MDRPARHSGGVRPSAHPHGCTSARPLALWEEVARDGAQARTLLTAEQRAHIARAMVRIMGPSSGVQLVFAAGFPSIGHGEFEIVRQLAQEVTDCALVTHGRATAADVSLGVESLKGAAFGRISFFAPASAQFRKALRFGSADDVRCQTSDLARRAVDLAAAEGLAVDVALADASRADPSQLIDLAGALSSTGVRIIKLCDSVGCLLPHEAARMVAPVRDALPPSVAVGVHLHNDLGLGLANTLESVASGAEVAASAWLGLGERAGLPRTEELLLVLQQRGMEFLLGPERQPSMPSGLSLDLHHVRPLARAISAWTSQPLRNVDPVVGDGLCTLSTGTPFSAPSVFRPYDPAEVLGVSTKICLTQMASTRVVEYLALQLGYQLAPDQLVEVRNWAKDWAYYRATAVVPPEAFAARLELMFGRASPTQTTRGPA